jgi:hypothetical protein
MKIADKSKTDKRLMKQCLEELDEMLGAYGYEIAMIAMARMLTKELEDAYRKRRKYD